MRTSVDNTVSVLLGNGDGTFQPAVELPGGPSSRYLRIVAGDFTATASSTWPSPTWKITLFRCCWATATARSSPGHLRAGCFQDQSWRASSPTTAGSTWPLLNSNGVSVLLGNGDGTFQPALYQAAEPGTQAIVAGDFNGDGRVRPGRRRQYVISGGIVSVLLGNGDGGFQASTVNPAGQSPQSIVAGDFNGDGRLDLAVVDNGSNDVSILLGNGDGTFQPPIQYATGPDPYAIAVGDFNGDGRLDLAVTNGDYGSSGTVSVLLGNGDGTFQPQVTYPVSPDLQVISEPQNIVAGDFRGDGKLDLAVADYGSSYVSVLLGNGDGTFQPAGPVSARIRSLFPCDRRLRRQRPP